MMGEQTVIAVLPLRHRELQRTFTASFSNGFKMKHKLSSTLGNKCCMD